MSEQDTRIAILETKVAALEAALKAPKSTSEVSTTRPRYDFEIKIGRDKGKKPSELSSRALDSLAGFMDKCAANPQPGKEQYVDSNRKAATSYRMWAAYKRAVEQGLVKEETRAADPDWVTDAANADDFHSNAEDDINF